MPLTQTHEIAPASRLENVRYAIRDLACVADEVIAQGHKVLPLNVGDPNVFDFQTPAHIIDAVHKAMRDGKNGYAPSDGIPQALAAIRGEAARKGITTVRDVFVTSGVSETVDLCLSALVNPGEDVLTDLQHVDFAVSVGSGLRPVSTGFVRAWNGKLNVHQPNYFEGTRQLESVLAHPAH